MRDFKFQVYATDWDGVKGLYDVSSITLMNELEGTLSVVFTNSSGDIEKCIVRKEDVRQYTGKKDKNGKEIYDGDIVKCHDGFVYTVDWCEEDAMFYYKDPDRDEEGDLKMSAVSFEVIGNIYENLNLIK